MPTQSLSDGLKAEVSSKSKKRIDEHLNPAHIKPPAKNREYRYVTELSTAGNRAISISAGFTLAIIPKLSLARSRVVSPAWGYKGGGKFDLAYMRHNGHRNVIHYDLSVDAC